MKMKEYVFANALESNNKEKIAEAIRSLFRVSWDDNGFIEGLADFFYTSKSEKTLHILERHATKVFIEVNIEADEWVGSVNMYASHNTLAVLFPINYASPHEISLPQAVQIHRVEDSSRIFATRRNE